jgi:hypothetical protein
MSLAGRRHGQFVSTGLIVAAAVALTACGSSGGSRPPSSNSGGSSSSSPPAAPATVATTAAGTPADPATRAAITTAFQDFFDYQSTAKQSQDALQNGDLFTAVLNQQGTQSYAQKSAATVSSAKLISPDTAKVTFSVLVGGQPLLPDADGYAVRENGRWKVAATTFCNLLTLEGDKADACKDPSVIALPQ